MRLGGHHGTMKKNNKIIAIVAGGTLDVSMLVRICKADYVIGVDRGAYWLIKNRVIPDVAIGDFDSVTKIEFQKIEKKIQKIISHPVAKDATDLELAVEHAQTLNPKEVGIFGAIGTRFDHSFAGIQLLLKLSSYNIYGYIVDNFNEITIVRRVLKLSPSKIFRYVSIFPLHEKAMITLTGFRYNVLRQPFVCGSTLGVSNEIVASSACVTIHKGTVLLVQSRD